MKINKIKEMKNLFYNYLLSRALKYFTNNGYVIQFESSQYVKNDIGEKIKKRGFVLHHNGWYCKGFVYVRILDDCIELKTISDKADRSMYISVGDFSIDYHLKYLEKLLK